MSEILFNTLSVNPVLGLAFLPALGWLLGGATISAGSIFATSKPTQVTNVQGDLNQEIEKSSALDHFKSYLDWLIVVGIAGGAWYLYKKFRKKKK